MKKRILTVGLDVTLAESRASVLSIRYETATTVPLEALQQLRRHRFDLMLVCYTTPRDEAQTIIQAAHEEFPALCIVHLRIVSQQIITFPVAHRLVTLNYHPDGWLAAIDDLLAPGHAETVRHIT